MVKYRHPIGLNVSNTEIEERETATKRIRVNDLVVIRIHETTKTWHAMA